jgi:mannosyltransferase
MSHLQRPIRLILFLFGAALVMFAIGVANDAYGRFLLGGNEKNLSWGPTLFRILLALHGGLLIALSSIQIIPDSIDDQGLTDLKQAPTKTTPFVFVAMVALSIVALALRLWNLNSDLWIDEVFTLLDFVREPIGEILTSFPSQNQHMLFSILAHVSTSIFGESSWSLRLPSVFFGIASIWAFFFMARRLVGTQEALLGSVLMTVSYHHIWFSQNARGYMGLLLFTLMATWFWFEALETNKWKWWLGYAATIVMGMWVHPTMAFVVAAHGIVHVALLIWPGILGSTASAFSPERRAGIRPFIAWLLSVTVTLQLYALSLPEFLAVGLHEESKDSEWTNPIWVVTESLQSLKIGFAGTLVLVCGGAFVAFGWARLFKLNRRAAVMMVLPSLLAGVSMLLLGHNIWPRFFFFSMGFGLLTVIYGAVELPKFLAHYFKPLRARQSIVSFAGVGFCLLVIIASLTTLPKNYALPKQNFSGAKNFVERNTASGDGIVAVSLAGVVYGSYLKPHWPVASTGTELETIQNGSERVWLVYTLPIEVKAFRPDLWKIIENDYELVKVFPGTLNGGEVFVCQKKLN